MLTSEYFRARAIGHAQKRVSAMAVVRGRDSCLVGASVAIAWAIVENEVGPGKKKLGGSHFKDTEFLFSYVT